MNLQHDLVACVAAHQSDRAGDKLACDESEENEIYPLMTHRSPMKVVCVTSLVMKSGRTRGDPPLSGRFGFRLSPE